MTSRGEAAQVTFAGSLSWREGEVGPLSMVTVVAVGAEMFSGSNGVKVP